MRRRPRDEEPERYEIVEQARDFEARDFEVFDRIAFANRALDILRPKNLKVVFYERGESMHIERGRDPRKSRPDWALVGIPPHASRENIAYGLAELTGLHDQPFVVELLMNLDTFPRPHPYRD
ncbi:MAG: hypothetical protein AAGA56_15765 [Myxococcota bacterium]